MDYSTLIIVGAIVTLFTQGVKILQKKYTHLNEYFTIAVAVILSLFAATGYYVLQKAELLETFAQILAFSGAIYVFLIKRLERR